MMDHEERIARWLSDDPGLAGAARAMAFTVSGVEDLNPLRLWVTNLLFDSGYNVVVEDLAWIANRDGDVNEAAVVRAEIGLVLFSVANWERVTQLVKTYTEEK